MARQFYYAESDAEDTSTSSTYAVKATLTFTPDDNSTYFIIAAYQQKGTTGVFCQNRLINNAGSVLSLTSVAGIYATDYFSYGGIGIEAFTTGHGAQTYKTQYANSDNATSVTTKNHRLIAIKKDAADQSVSATARTTTTSTTFSDKATLTFTPATEGYYDIIASAEIDSALGDIAEAQITVDGTVYFWSQLENGGTSNRGWTVSKRVLLTAASHTIKIQFRAETSGRTIGIENAHIIALREDTFANAYAAEALTRTTTISTTYVDKTTLTQTPVNTQHLVVSAGLLDTNFETSAIVYGKLLAASTDKNELAYRGRTTFYRYYTPWFTFYAAELAAASTTWKNQYKSGDGTNDAGLDNSIITILELGATEPPEAGPTPLRALMGIGT